MTTDRESRQMPKLFIGHGSPMNAIEDNIFSRGIEAVAQTLPRPKAILCISAHWETRGTFVSASPHPETLHDYGGFPKELYEVTYPAPGNLEPAQRVRELIKHLYPKADIPVVELSIDYTKPASWHYQHAEELAPLRKEGIMIVTSGN